MIRRRTAATGLLVIAVLLAAGTGYAAFTATAYVNGVTKAGTLGPFVWGPSPGYGWSAANDQCTAWVGTTHTSSDTLFLQAENLAPGDICTFGDNLTNMGTLPATTSEQIDPGTTGALCSEMKLTDNFFSPSTTIGAGGQYSTVPHTIAGHGYIQWAGFLELAPGIGNSFSGQNCSFMVTVTGTAGT